MNYSFEVVEEAIRASWSRETCNPLLQACWGERCKAQGQCLVTAIVIQNHLEGDILFCRRLGHYWNNLPDGREVDLTREQFHSRRTKERMKGVKVARGSLLFGVEATQCKIGERMNILQSKVQLYLQEHYED
ncbi:MAG: hypothetical protein AABW80_01615 [Nanoarchaeota archaeon]